MANFMAKNFNNDCMFPWCIQSTFVFRWKWNEEVRVSLCCDFRWEAKGSRCGIILLKRGRDPPVETRVVRWEGVGSVVWFGERGGSMAMAPPFVVLAGWRSGGGGWGIHGVEVRWTVESILVFFYLEYADHDLLCSKLFTVCSLKFT